MKKVYLETPEAVIKALKDGKEVKTKFWERTIKLVDGIIVQVQTENAPIVSIGGGLTMKDKPYIEEETLKIEVGKFYKTRHGEKVRCFFKCVNGSAMFSIDGYDTILNTNSNGECLPTGEEYHLDIIGPWED